MNERAGKGTSDRTSGVDVAVIGAGPCGLAVGIAAEQAGLRCRIFDRGCVVNALVAYPTQMRFFSTPENLEIGGLPFVCREDKPTRDEALKYYRRVTEHYELDVHQYEEVTSVEPDAGEGFILTTRDRHGETSTQRSRWLVVATGFYGTPNLLHVPGEDLPKVTHYFKEAHPYYDQDCLVVGGGNSAVEAALELYRARARVTLVHFLDGLDRGVKPWVRPDIQNRIKEGSIDGRFLTRVAEIAPRWVDLRRETSDEVERIENDWVFAMTGYRPETRLLRQLGVTLDGDMGIPQHDPKTMETNVPGVFVAGVICAGLNANKIFIENGREHGQQIIEHLAS